MTLLDGRFPSILEPLSAAFLLRQTIFILKISILVSKCLTCVRILVNFFNFSMNKKMADADQWKQWRTSDHVPFVSTPEEKCRDLFNCVKRFLGNGPVLKRKMGRTSRWVIEFQFVSIKRASGRVVRRAAVN